MGLQPTYLLPLSFLVLHIIHLPVSTTHVISSSIMGVGAAQNAKGVHWGVARRIVITWIITLPMLHY